MQALRRAGLVAALVVCAGCVLALRHLVLRDPTPLPSLEERFPSGLVPFAVRMQFPNVLPVFLLALLAIAMAALALAWKRLGLPSPARDVRLEGPEHPFLSRALPGRACLAVFAAVEVTLAAILVGDSIPPAWLWAASLTALIAAAWFADLSAHPLREAEDTSGPPVRGAEAAGVLLVAATCVALAGHGLNGWEWAGSEDSYGFYGVARELYGGVRNVPVLSPDGVYAMYAIASSWMQTILFPVLGPTGEALRAGNLVLVAALAVLGHVFARPLIGRTGAFATSALLGSSVLVQTYAKNGYNNLQGVFFAMLALTFASRAAATRRWTPLVLSGIAAGAGLLSFALAAISGGAVLLWLALSGPPSKSSFRAAMVFCAAALAAAMPCLLSRHYLQVHLVKVSVFSPELEEAGPKATPLSSRVLHGVAQPVLNFNPGHATAGPRVDPVSAALLLVGFAALAGGTGARAASRALLAIALYWPVSIGLLQPYAYPSSTWILLATPAWALLGGCGVASLAAVIRSPRAAGAAAFVTICAAAAWSTQQVHVASFRVAPLPPLAFTMAAARAAGGIGAPATLIIPVPPHSGDAGPIIEALSAGDVPSVRLETPSFGDARATALLEELRESPALFVLYEIGAPFEARTRLRESVRAAWPGADEVLYRTLPSQAAEPCVRVFVNARARAAVSLLPARNRSKE